MMNLYGRNPRVLLFPLLAALFLLPVALIAQSTAPIRYLPEQKLWVLDSDRATYVVGVNESGQLQNVYWGKKLGRDEDLQAAHTRPEHASFDSSETMSNLEYPGWGARLYTEPCLKVTLADGDRDLVLKYDSYELQGDTLKLRTRDIQYDLFVTLIYKLFPHEDIIRKSSVVENRTPQVVTLESAQSGVWYVAPGEGYRLTYLSGRWAGETQVKFTDPRPITDGTTAL